MGMGRDNEQSYSYSILQSYSNLNSPTSVDWEQGWRSGESALFHQCGPGSIPGLGVSFGLSLLFLYRAVRFQLSPKANSLI